MDQFHASCNTTNELDAVYIVLRRGFDTRRVELIRIEGEYRAHATYRYR